MASKIGLSYRREEAQHALDLATARLANRLGLNEITMESPARRDPDLAAVEHLEALAKAVDKIDDAVREHQKEHDDADAAHATAIGAVELERDDAIKERDAAIARIAEIEKDLKAAERKLAKAEAS